MAETEPSLPAVDSRATFRAAVGQAPVQALAARARRMAWVDADFIDWPLDDAALLLSLGAWLRLPQRELVLIGSDFAEMQRHRPRFMAWYRQWAHAVHVWSPSTAEDAKLPTLLLIDGSAALQLFDRQHWRARWSVGAVEVRPWTDEIDALLQRCAPALPATTLGL
jgi:hypothetical protein